MADWPAGLRVGPLRDWPGVPTPHAQRRRSPFRSAEGEVSLLNTLDILDRELWAFGPRVSSSAVLLIAIPPEQFRLDGRPRANAVASHPGVVLSFDAPNIGDLSYPCDQFTTWPANLRAIALALEALRKVDRYGVTRHGEQYRGFLAIEASPGGAEDDAGFIRAMSGERPMLDDRAGMIRAVRLAKRNTHPDTPGGDAEVFTRVTAAESRLRDGGYL